MPFITPLAFAWLALVPLLLLLYFRTRPRQVARVSNLFLWRDLDVKWTAPAIRRFRPDWQLILQLAFLLLTITALARPVIGGGAERIVIVLDASAGMQAQDGDATRFDRARRSARALVADAARGSRIGLVVAGTSIRMEVEPGEDRAALRMALDAAAPTTAAPDLSAAVALARSAGKPDRIVVLTDVSARVSAAANLDIVRHGTATGNIGIVRLEARRHPGSAFDGQVLVTVANFGATAADVPLALAAGSVDLARDTLALRPGAQRTIVHDVEGVTGVIEARVQVRDALAADDVATTTLARPPVPVRLAAPAARVLDAALRANFDIRLAGPGEAADVEICADCAPRGSAVILHRARTPGGRLRITDADHPVTAFLDLRGLTPRVTRLERGTGGAVLISAGSAPVVVATERPDARQVSIGIDVTDPTIANDPAVPILLANALTWVAPPALARSIGVLSEAESNLAAVTPSAEDAAADAAAVPADGDSAWRVFLLLALCALGAESLLSFRRKPEATLKHSATVAGRFRLQAVALRGATFGLLLLALAGLHIPTGRSQRHAVFLLDVSDSVPAADRDAAVNGIARFAATLEPRDEVSVVAFGGEPVIDAERVQRYAAQSLASSPATAATDIAAAMRVGGALARPGGRIVLLSDGRQTAGDARAEADALAAARITVDTVPLGSSSAPEVLISELRAPVAGNLDDPIDIAALVRSTRKSAAVVRVMRDGAPMAERRVDLTPDGIEIVAFSDVNQVAGVRRYDVEIESDSDTIVSNNHAAATVTVKGPLRVLLVGTDGLGGAWMRRAGMDVRAIPASALPATPDGLAPYDAVWLNNVPAAAVPDASQRALAAYVEEQGGGLLMAGAARAFGPGGWAGSRIEALLPVQMRPPVRQQAADAAVVLVLDRSGSMATIENGVRKIELSVRAATPLVEMFAPARRLGVVAFDAAPATIAALGAPVDTARLVETLRTLDAGGTTRIAPAIAIARDWLARSNATRRHIVLVSDGRSSPDDAASVLAPFDGPAVSISTIGIGRDVDRTLLGRLAQATGGRTYFSETLDALPGMFLEEAAQAAGGWTIEGPFAPVVQPHAVTRGVSPLPRVGGYVATTARDTAEIALLTPRRDPLLAAWRRGLGRSAVLTTDLDSAWAEGIDSSVGFAQLSVQMVRWTARPRDASTFRPSTTVTGTSAALGLDAYTLHAGFVNGLEVSADIQGPRPIRVPLTQTGPGLYSAAPLSLDAGAYTARLTASDPATGVRDDVVTSFEVSGAAEYREPGPDVALLGDIARATGGRALTSLADLSWPRLDPEYIDATHALAGAALLLFMVDVARRRGIVSASMRGVRRWQVLVCGVAVLVMLSKVLIENVLGFTWTSVVASSPDQSVLWAAAIVALLSVDLFIPVPSSLVMLASGAAFGTGLGAALSVVGSLAGNCVGFELARRQGRTAAERWIGREQLARMQAVFARNGAAAVVVSRPLPVLMETVSVAAGLSGMRRRSFVAASLAGTIPIAIVYAWAGSRSLQEATVVPAAILLVAVIAGAWLAARSLGFRMHFLSKRRAVDPEHLGRA